MLFYTNFQTLTLFKTTLFHIFVFNHCSCTKYSKRGRLEAIIRSICIYVIYAYVTVEYIPSDIFTSLLV